MSIRIDSEKCRKCGKCISVCPGNLIKKNSDGSVYVKREKDCWGCTSCLKECVFGAIDFFLGEDIGGRGSRLSYTSSGDTVVWTVKDDSGDTKEIVINKKESNRY